MPPRSSIAAHITLHFGSAATGSLAWYLLDGAPLGHEEQVRDFLGLRMQAQKRQEASPWSEKPLRKRHATSAKAPRKKRPPDPLSGRNIIVAIGIDQYMHWPTLYNAVSDAKGIHNLLVRGMDFESPIPPLLNATATKEAITELVKVTLPCELGQGDSLVLFFAGHGHTQVTEEDGQRAAHGCLVPVEARTDQPDDYLPLDVFLQNVNDLKAQRVLVILDSCWSGMALGSDVILKASCERSGGAPISDRCRRVISSARWDQKAQDSGPVQDHSLFTGCLIQGLDWGTADLLEDGTISASELGLFVRDYVDRESRSHQTPDFGIFKAGAQGELHFWPREDSSRGMRMRAYAAMQLGRLGEFETLVGALEPREKESPWISYLLYRKALLTGDVPAVLAHIGELRSQDLTRGLIPLTNSDVVTLKVQLEYFLEVLAVPEGDCPLEVKLQVGPDDPTVWMGPDESRLSTLVDEVPLEDVSGYEIPQGAIARLLVRNTGHTTVHVYFAAVRPDGKLVFGSLLHDPRLALEGLEPGPEVAGTPFKVANIGLTETRLFCSPLAIPSLLRPPSTATRYLEETHVSVPPELTRHSIWYRVLAPK